MTSLLANSYLILLFPLLSFVVNGLFLCRKSRKASAAFSVTMAGLAAAYAIALAVVFFFSMGANPTVAWQFRFLPVLGDFYANIGLLLDPLSAMMLVVVTTIAFFVNIYSIGYMREDMSSGRFFALLSLFAFSMLGLVIATNILQMFVFWELVGVSSYMLIGFWYHKPSAVSASKQAFILTRFADSFFLFGMVLVSYAIKSFDFATINAVSLKALTDTTVNLGLFVVPTSDALTFGAAMIFVGGWGKSAMFPMHIWLPNAMEGPTPVSSIIHSATMVVAGVYLVARLFPFFAGAGNTLELVMVVGAFTAIFAAVIACTQRDIKRILAYSTLSQLGYMMFALGASRLCDGSINTLGYTASTFHIFTHAFFKCMLFLVAGSLIHQVHTNDLDAMGGLRKKMPFTYVATLIACLAIAGIPPFSGFFSKDEILMTAFQSGHVIVFAIGLLTSGLTAFYMFRLFFLAFHGKARSEHTAHAHEDFAMTLPIVCLAVPSLLSGILAKNLFATKFLPGTLPVATAGHLAHAEWIPLAAGGMAVLGILLAAVLYARPKANIARALDSDNRSKLYKTIYRKFYFDEMYYAVVRQFIFRGVAASARFFEDYVIGSIVNICTATVKKAGALVREAECGYLPFYIGVMIVGVIFWYFIGNLPF